MGQTAIKRSGYPANQVMMVGDRAETDVLLAKQNHMVSALVLTGATDPSDAPSSGADIIAEDLSRLAKLLLDNPPKA